MNLGRGVHRTQDLNGSVAIAALPEKMRSSRFGEPVLESTSAYAGKYSRWTEISTIEASSRRSKDSSSTLSSKRRKSCRPSSSQSRNKCLPRLSAKSHPTASAAVAEDSVVAATTAKSHLYVCPSDYEHPSDYEQDMVIQNLESDCPWPNWPDYTSENQNLLYGVPDGIGPPTYSDTNSSYWGSEKHAEREGVDGQIGQRSHSEASSSCSLSDSESDFAWSTSPSSRSRGHEMRKTYSFWDDFIWGQSRPWKKIPHKKSFLTNLWDFKTETKVEEICDPILVSVNVLGSPGPLRLVVDKNDSVHHTIDFALRRYTAQKRQPALVDPAPFFGLYCRNPDFEALDDEAPIGHRGARQFHLYHKQRKDLTMESIENAQTSKSDETKKLIPTTNWIWNKINGMRSWAGSLVAAISRTLTLWVKDLNPKTFYRCLYMLSVNSVCLGMI